MNLNWVITTWKQPKKHIQKDRPFKKFCSGCNNFNDHTRSDRPKTMDFKEETNHQQLQYYQLH